jgi:hypothetical protein
MAIPQITINKQNGGIVRGLASDDSISGFVSYAAVPASFTTLPSGSGYKVFFSAQEAYNAGLVGDFSDETKAIGTISVTATMSNDTLTLNYGTAITTISNNQAVSYSLTGLTGSAAVAANQIANQINDRFNETGLLASANGSQVTLTAPSTRINPTIKQYGASINGTAASVSGSGSAKVSVSAFAGGVNSKYTVIKYHIDEYFRVGGTKLWVLLRTAPTAGFDEVTELQIAAGGEIRQMAVFNTAAFNAADIPVLQGDATSLAADKKYVQILYAANIKSVLLPNLPSLSTFGCENVSVVIGQDGANVGSKLYTLLGYSTTNIGSVLGALASFKVNESIAWVGKLQSIPYSTRELDVAAFANGDLVSTKTKAELDSIGNKNYIFLRKFDGLAGSFISDSLTATSPISDFFSIERNRTIDKSRRLCGIALLPFLSSPLLVDANGKLDPLTIGVFNGLISAQLDTMLNAQEISAYSVNIDPDQDVLTTDKLVINLQLVPVGVARFIEVNVSFSLSV